MSPLNSIISDAMIIMTAIIALLMNGCSTWSPPEPESEVRPRRSGTTNGRTFAVEAVIPRAISMMLHYDRHDRDGYQQDHHADQDFQRSPDFFFALFARNQRRHFDYSHSIQNEY